MDEAKAREILKNRFDDDGDLSDGVWTDADTCYGKTGRARLNDVFTPEELEAVAWWVRNKAKKEGE